MAFLPKFLGFLTIATALLAFLYNTNVDVRHTMCFLAGLGYLDFLGTEFLDGATRCMAETSTFYLNRDFKPGDGKIIPVAEMDCSQNFTLDKFRELTQDYTRPAVCRNFLKENKCREWGLDYFREVGNPKDTFRVQTLKEVEGYRRAFMRHTYPSSLFTANETYDKLSRGEQIYISFDNYFAKSNPKFVEDMNLQQYIPEIKQWILHTFFVSNFTYSTLGSPFHAAPNDNFFFQCRGRKHWYYVSPHELKYTSAYIANGVTFVSNYIDEKLIVDRIPIWEAKLEEGDMMYNPPFWLHAVGTVPGFTVSVANRAWREITPKKNNFYFDAMYKVGFPAFVSSIIWQQLVSKVARINSITLQNSIMANNVEGGALPVMN
eukprot:gene10865-11842_t